MRAMQRRCELLMALKPGPPAYGEANPGHLRCCERETWLFDDHSFDRVSLCPITLRKRARHGEPCPGQIPASDADPRRNPEQPGGSRAHPREERRRPMQVVRVLAPGPDGEGEEVGTAETVIEAGASQSRWAGAAPIGRTSVARTWSTIACTSNSTTLGTASATCGSPTTAADMVSRPRSRCRTFEVGRAAKKIEGSCLRVLTGFCACEVARHRTDAPLPASRKLGCPFGHPAPPSAPAGRASPARPGPGKKVYLKTSSTFTL